MRDAGLEQWWRDLISRTWPDNDHEPHLVDVIARSRGWAPLVPGETMTVTFGGTRYTIRREADGR
mgnify:CR=1 FL=1